MMAKLIITQELRQKMYDQLALHSLDKQYKKLNQEIVKFSDAVYDLRISSGFKQTLADLGVGEHWLKYSETLHIYLKSNEYVYQGYRVDPISIVKNTANEYNLPISSTTKNQVQLFFSSPRPVPLNRASEIFSLTDAEHKQYVNIISKHEKRINKVIDGVKTAMTVIASFKTFEDLFEHWAASEKLFKEIYASRKEEVSQTRKKLLPSFDVSDLNNTLSLEE